MLSRRGAIGAVGAMVFGGGLPRRRADQRYDPPRREAIPGGRAGTFRGRLVVVYGSAKNQGVFVYSGAPAAGNLIASVAATASTDSHGNAYLAGQTSYDNTGSGYKALNVNSSALVFYTASTYAGPWTTGASLTADSSGNVQLASPGKLSLTAGTSGVDVLEGASVSGPIALAEQSSAPSTPTGAGDLYVDSAGDLYYLGPSGTSTKIASA